MHIFSLKYYVLSKRGKVKKKLNIWYNFLNIIPYMDPETKPEKREIGSFRERGKKGAGINLLLSLRDQPIFKTPA
jgi:hypothetical protein